MLFSYSLLSHDQAIDDAGVLDLTVKSFQRLRRFETCWLVEEISVIFTSVAFLQEAEAEKTWMDTKYSADANIADSNRQFKMMQAQFDQEVNTKVSQ
jgi:hypothetical protein